MRILCPAKINLDLRVGPLATDGFHPLRSWVTTVGLFDTLDISPGQGRELSLTCSDPAIPCGASNLVLRAALALQALATRDGHWTARADPAGAAMHLHKRIPAGGGLGGGSSDAAATLLALRSFWQLDADDDVLAGIAAGIGSDVPLFLAGPSSLCTGRGERLRAIAPSRARWATLILPPIAMPTPAVYGQFDAMPPSDDAWQRPFDDAWPELPATELLPRLANDLERPAFALRPDLAALRDSAEQAIARPVRMSGSGSTLFSVFDHEAESIDAVRRLETRFGECLNAQPGVAVLSVPLAPATVRRF